MKAPLLPSYKMICTVPEGQVGRFLTLATRAGASNVGFELIENVERKDARMGKIAEVEDVIVPILRHNGGSADRDLLADALKLAGFSPTNIHRRLDNSAERSELFHKKGAKTFVLTDAPPKAKRAAKTPRKVKAKAKKKPTRNDYSRSARDIIISMVQRGPTEPAKIHARFEREGRGASSSGSMISQLIAADVLKRNNDGALVPGKSFNGAGE